MADQPKIVLTAEDRTRAAFESARRGLANFESRLTSSAAGVVASFGAIGAATAAATVAINRLNPKPAIDAADALNKLSQRSGIAVESLSSLQYQAGLADVSADDLAASLKRLNVNIAAAARGEQGPASAFAAIGVAVTDAAGKARSADAVLADIAERFAGYADGPEKVAIANALAGKSFEALIPLLNSGASGLASGRAELERFGGVISTELAAKSEQFNDNLAKLKVAVDALQVAMAGRFIDSLVEYSDEAVRAAQNGELLEFSLKKIFAVFSGELSREFVFGKALPEGPLKDAQDNVRSLADQIARLQDYLARTPNSSGTVAAIDALQKKAFEARRDLQGLQAGGGRGLVNPPLISPAAEPDKQRAPSLPDTVAASAARAAADAAARAADAARTKALDNAIRRVQANLAAERDAFQGHNTALAADYEAGQLSIERFYAAKQQAQEDNLQRTRTALAEELRLLQAAQDKTPKSRPQDREALQGKIEDVYARQADAARDAARATQEAERQRAAAVADFQRSLVELDAQLAELSGDRYGAELLRNAQTLDQARALLAKGGGDEGRERALQQRLDLQAGLNELQRRYGLISERAQLSEEAFLIQAERSGASRAETEAGLLRLREQSLSQLDELIAATSKLASETTDPAVIAYFDQIKLARERAFDAKDPGLVRFNELAAEGGNTIANAFGDAILAGGKLGDVFDSLAQQLARLITQQLIVIPLAQQITNIIRSSGIGSGIAGIIGGLFGASGGGGVLPGGVGAAPYHSGGVVGQDGGAMRALPAALWEGANVYHRGGIAGLAPDEVPAILRRGEEVLTEADPRHRNAGRGGLGLAGSGDTVTVNVYNNGEAVQAKSSQRQTPEGTIIDVVLDAVAQDMASGGRVHDATQRRFGLSAGGSLPRY